MRAFEYFVQIKSKQTNQVKQNQGNNTLAEDWKQNKLYFLQN